MSSIIARNTDLNNFFEKKMCKDVCNLMLGFLGKDKIVLGKYQVSLYEKKQNNYVDVIKLTKCFVFYKISPQICLMKDRLNCGFCQDPNIDVECGSCKIKREDKTFKKKIFIDKNKNEYCKIDMNDHRGDHYMIKSN
jgi:hypothetical protein